MAAETNEPQNIPISPVIAIETKIGRVEEGVGNTNQINSFMSDIGTLKTSTEKNIGEIQTSLASVKSDIADLEERFYRQYLISEKQHKAIVLIFILNCICLSLISLGFYQISKL